MPLHLVRARQFQVSPSRPPTRTWERAGKLPSDHTPSQERGAQAPTRPSWSFVLTLTSACSATNPSINRTPCTREELLKAIAHAEETPACSSWLGTLRFKLDEQRAGLIEPTWLGRAILDTRTPRDCAKWEVACEAEDRKRTGAWSKTWADGASLTTAAFLRSTEQLEREIQEERLEEEEMMRELKRLRNEKNAEGSAKQPLKLNRRAG